MGRKKKYLTEEEIKEANILKAQRYYDRKELLMDNNVKRALEL